MDDSITRIVVKNVATFSSGRIGGEFLAIIAYDAGDRRVSVQYDLRLLNGPPLGCVTLSVADAPALISVLRQALEFALTRADEVIRTDVEDMRTALRDAASSRTE